MRILLTLLHTPEPRLVVNRCDPENQPEPFILTPTTRIPNGNPTPKPLAYAFSGPQTNHTLTGNSPSLCALDRPKCLDCPGQSRCTRRTRTCS